MRENHRGKTIPIVGIAKNQTDGADRDDRRKRESRRRESPNGWMPSTGVENPERHSEKKREKRAKRRLSRGEIDRRKKTLEETFRKRRSERRPTKHLDERETDEKKKRGEGKTGGKDLFGSHVRL